MPNTGSTPPAAPSLRFGPSQRFELQPTERRLLVDGQPATLGRRALDLLIALAEQPDHLLTKNELLDRVWPGLVVEEANLQMQISNLRKVLGGEVIATVPGRGYRFAAVVDGSAAAPSRSSAPASALASTPLAAPRAAAHRLIGRDHDLADLEGLLQGGSCVTLVGTSGVGKTSLARAAAARWSGRSVWVDLAALAHGRQVAGALARALGLQLSGNDDEAPAQLVAALRTQTLLLVLDNAEHLIQTCAELATLLRPLVGVELLVTSQVPLAVAGEQLLRLEPLALPGPEANLEGQAAEGALALLVERIVAADHRFAATPAVLPLLRAVCAQLDGLPLALEMAAARVPLLGLQGVHDALAQRFALLTRGHRDAATRHRTLHNALDWSYRLLDPAEQRLFRALGVFADGFTLDLAVALMTDDADARWDVIDGLATLADRSLVVVGGGDPPRYHLLETMRAYAIEQLCQAPAPADEEHIVRRRHAGAMLALFTRYQPDDHVAKAQCEAEMENVREAVSWAQAHDLALAAQLTALVTPTANFTVWRQEATQWLRALEAAMDQPAGQALPAAVQAAWWTEFARTGSIRRDPHAAAAAQRALALWDALGETRQALLAACVCVRSVGAAGPELDRACDDLRSRVAALPELTAREQLQVHGALAVAATERSDLEAILSGRLTEVALARQLGLQATADAAESNVVFVLNAMGRYAEAAERGRALLERIDASSGSAKGNLPWVLHGLLKALVQMGRLEEAHALVPRAWAACEQFGVPVVAPTVAMLAALRRRFETAAQLIGHAREAFASRGMAMSVTDRDGSAQVHALASARPWALRGSRR
ncbi:MAG TPA: winged helix-turn-helix domain-containing protein [Burkholderiaceae bacterium]|nr:winged helix-turn-helix domain-containing protein [Burkholderiaceae bacterium]